MPSETGIWNQEEADTGHVFDYRLAQWLADHLFTDKDVPIIDMGCGPASYLKYFHDRGYQDLSGVEGTELRQSEFANVAIQDLTEHFFLDKIGNVMCLEVAEHIPYDHMDMFLKNIVRHLEKNPSLHRWLVLSWGVPGQGGLGHVNCQHNIWVVNHMKRYFDLVLNTELSLEARAAVSDHARWFRDTLMVFEYLPS